MLPCPLSHQLWWNLKNAKTPAIVFDRRGIPTDLVFSCFFTTALSKRETKVGPLCFFFSVLDERITKKKTCVFFLPSTRIRLLPIFGKKQSISGDKKAMSFLLVFFVTLIKFFLNRSKVFFYLVALINFSKNMFNGFFFLNIFFPPSLIRFWIFSDLKQRY